jgi:hypothetical protein
MKVVEVAPIIGEEGSNGEAFGSLFFIKKKLSGHTYILVKFFKNIFIIWYKSTG